MSYKSQLQTNNANLQSLIDKANALPDAGGGGGGDTDIEDRLLSRGLETYTNDRIGIIKKYAFYEQIDLTTASFASVTNVGEYAFGNCMALTNIDLPSAQHIESCAFDGCINLTRIELPSAEYIYDAFTYGPIDTVILPNEEITCGFEASTFYGTSILDYDFMPTGYGFIYVPTSLYENYIAMFTEILVYEIGEDETYCESIARAIFLKIEEHPEICD